MDTGGVGKRGDAQADQVGPGPQLVAVNKFGALGVEHRGVAAGDGVAGALEGGEGFFDPAAFRLPIGHRRDEFSLGLHLFVDGRVVGNLHLVNRHAVGPQLDRLLDVALPQRLGLLQHAGDQIDVDLGEILSAGALVGGKDLGGAVRAAVDLEHVVVEVFDA